MNARRSIDMTEHSVDWLRGKRDYVRVADVLAVAPIPPDAKRLELHFHAVTNCSGRWMRADELEGLDGDQQIVVSLKIIDPLGNANRLGFVVNRSSPISRRIEDADESRISVSVNVAERRTSLSLLNEYNIWEHVIASAKALGDAVHPDVKWYVLYVKTDIARIPDVTTGHVMSMQVRRKRLAITELAFSIDGTMVGTVGVCDRNE
jgi:hypothetical protein